MKCTDRNGGHANELLIELALAQGGGKLIEHALDFRQVRLVTAVEQDQSLMRLVPLLKGLDFIGGGAITVEQLILSMPALNALLDGGQIHVAPGITAHECVSMMISASL